MPCLSLPLSSQPQCCSTPLHISGPARQSYRACPARVLSHPPRLAPSRPILHPPHCPTRLHVTCAAAQETLPRSSEAASLYAVLDLPQNVSQAEIKSAYRKMARRYHPDVCDAADKEGSARKFLEAQEAYEILSDPERRAEYDYNLLHPFCAQALGRGFASDLTMSWRRRRGNADRHEVSVAWKLQWEAQLSNLRRRQQSKSFAKESWGAKMRRNDIS